MKPPHAKLTLERAQITRRYSQKKTIILLLSALAFIVVLSAAYFASRGPVVTGGSFGRMQINDSGERHGGFEYAGVYAATLTFYMENWGELSVTLTAGLGDPVTRHTLTIKSWTHDGDRFILRAETWTMILLRNPGGSNSGEDYYRAVWSPAEPEENVGDIQSSWFGLPASYFVELTLSWPAVV